MKQTVVMLALLAGLTGIAFAIDQAKPGERPAMGPDPHASMHIPPAELTTEQLAQNAEDRTGFERQVQLDKFRLLAVQHQDQVKILDSWARQSLTRIRGRQSIDGNDPLYTALDIAFRPEAWVDQNIIYIQAIPIREQLARLAGSNAEAERILQQGLVSPHFIERKDVLELLKQISFNTRQAGAVNKIFVAYEAFTGMGDTLALVPPGSAQRGQPWHVARELFGNIAAGKEEAAELGIDGIPFVPGYTKDQSLQTVMDFSQLAVAWRCGDVPLANAAIFKLVALMPAIDPEGYPSAAKRTTELWYNRTFYGTIADVFLYFVAMTLFLLVSVGVGGKLRPYAYSFFTLAVALHLASMGVRMWLAGRWPTQNQFESVLGAALLGCVLGWILETWKKNGLFGMAFAFVGFLAMTACMAAPYMFGNDLGGAISKTAGILQTYWLYIHVNIVISSYALISASFIMGAVYLLQRLWHWINPLEPGIDDASPIPSDSPVVVSREAAGGGTAIALVSLQQIEARRAAILSTLDQANMVILQMALWFLGIGIICGAVWADHSWGRPWGWDPKETFALITWIVYLIIVHVRMIVPQARADTTAWLSVVGFGIMMFNWIGVNYFLVGLHSYA